MNPIDRGEVLISHSTTCAFLSELSGVWVVIIAGIGISGAAIDAGDDSSARFVPKQVLRSRPIANASPLTTKIASRAGR